MFFFFFFWSFMDPDSILQPFITALISSCQESEYSKWVVTGCTEFTQRDEYYLLAIFENFTFPPPKI